MVLLTIEGEARSCNDIWIANSAISMHITNLEASLYNVGPSASWLKLEMASIYTTKVGKLWVEYEKNSEEQDVFILENILTSGLIFLA